MGAVSPPDIFATYAPLYLQRGLVPLPITLGTKACNVRGWNKLDPAVDQDRFQEFIKSKAHFGIGVRMGTIFPDGSRLVAIDVDHDDHVNVVRYLLRDLVSGRVGQKGALFFVRFKGRAPNKKVETASGIKTADMLFANACCVIPPTIHKDTGQPYKWIGQPLHEVAFESLPLIEG